MHTVICKNIRFVVLVSDNVIKFKVSDTLKPFLDLFLSVIREHN